MRSASSTDSMKMVHKGPVSFKANAFARILESNDQESTQGGHNTLLRSSIASNCSASGCADFSSPQAASCGPQMLARTGNLFKDQFTLSTLQTCHQASLQTLQWACKDPSKVHFSAWAFQEMPFGAGPTGTSAVSN